MANFYKIITFGCQMNENDSEKLSGMLEAMGYVEAEEPKKSDVVIINTCSVRANADDKFFGSLGEYKALKKENPEAVIAVCGCMMQQEVFRKEIKEKYRFVDIVFGTHNIHEFPALLSEYKENKKKIVRVLEDSSDIVESLPCKRQFKHKAYVSITFGCDNFCSYCIVPYTRGREKSREEKDILNEIRTLAENGCKEVMLLGQNVNSYGKGLKEPCDFAQLLKDVNEIEGLERIRFMTSHPKDLTDEVINAIIEGEKICKSIHLPVQCGSDRILKLMNRHYNRDYYIGLVEKIRKAIPEVTISTDIIVGFPGESEEDFLDTLDIVKKCSFDAAFTFIYSPRIGTRAALMDNPISESIVKDRFNRLLDTLQDILTQKATSYSNTIQQVIVDGISRSDAEVMSGRTRSNKLVNFRGSCKVGDTVDVKITEAKTYYLAGEMI